jgi:L-rhamnose mutarotase
MKEHGMNRVCFTLKVKADRLDEYKRLHRDVWPEMRDALRATGWHNYSLFLKPDGTLIGYVETPDFAKAVAGMADYPVNERWQTMMAPFFESLGDDKADEAMQPIEEVFHLD